MSDWNKCDHVWKVTDRGSDLGDVPGAGPREEVECVKCKCPGERQTDSGEVHWPAT